MWRRVFGVVVAVFLVGVVSASAQNATIACTDSTNTNCTIKKNQPFSVTADPADPSDTVPTDKYRMYVDGTKVAEQLAVAGTAPVFAFGSGLSNTGDHQLYMEAVGTAYDSTGAAVEVSSGPSNVVTVHIVTGSLSAPKNVRIGG